MRPCVEVKLLAEEGELYILVHSESRVLKERSMRTRRLKKLWQRLSARGWWRRRWGGASTADAGGARRLPGPYRDLVITLITRRVQVCRQTEKSGK